MACPAWSILDGWWIEGCIEDVTGWGISEAESGEDFGGTGDARDATALYEKLDHILCLVPSSKKRVHRYHTVRHCPERVVLQYAKDGAATRCEGVSPLKGYKDRVNHLWHCRNHRKNIRQ